MRKIIPILCLLVATLTIMSCSDDDGDLPATDAIVGKWKIIQEFENDVELEVNCTGISVFEYKLDGTYTYDQYEGFVGQVCEFLKLVTGSWQNNGDATYKFTEDTYSYTAAVSLEEDTLVVSGQIEGGAGTYKTVYQKQ